MTENLFDFSKELRSIEWINSLPGGLVSRCIDTRYNGVTIQQDAEGCVIYVGPKNPDSGGDGIMITLDADLQLLDYVIERIEPVPPLDRD